MRTLQGTVMESSSFAPVVEAFPDAVAVIAKAVQMKFQSRTDLGKRRRDGTPESEIFFFTDKLLLDLAHVPTGGLDPRTIAADCAFVAKAVEHPEASALLAEALTGLKSGTMDGVGRASAAMKKLGLTETDAIDAGGGVLWLIAVVALACLAGCSDSCGNTATGVAGGAKHMTPKAGPAPNPTP